MSKQVHTPCIKGEGFDNGSGGFTHIYIDDKKYSASEIVTACNSHYELVEALRSMIVTYGKGVGPVDANAREVLARATNGGGNG